MLEFRKELSNFRQERQKVINEFNQKKKEEFDQFFKKITPIIEKYVSEKNIDIILLCLGANDMLRGISPNETKKNLDQIIIKILNKKIQIVVAGMIAPDSHGQDYKNKFDKILLE